MLSKQHRRRLKTALRNTAHRAGQQFANYVNNLRRKRPHGKATDELNEAQRLIDGMTNWQRQRYHRQFCTLGRRPSLEDIRHYATLKRPA